MPAGRDGPGPQERGAVLAPMHIPRYLKILELKPGASLEETKQAYKDLASVWHPDRFSGNPRLKRKAEEKMKELNRAYEALLRDFESRESEPGRPDRGGHNSFQRQSSRHRSSTEAAFELGTEGLLRACHSIYAAARRFLAQEERAGDKGKKA